MYIKSINRIRRSVFILLLALIGCSSSELHEDYYDNGKLKERYQLIDGKIQGQLTRYFPDGTKSYDGFFDKGKRVGWHIHYSETGAARFKTLFGVRDGKEYADTVVTLNDLGKTIAIIAKAKKNLRLTYDSTKAYSVGDTVTFKVEILNPKYTYCKAALGPFDENLVLTQDVSSHVKFVHGSLKHSVIMKVILHKPGTQSLTGFIRDYDYTALSDSTGTVKGEDSFFRCHIKVKE